MKHTRTRPLEPRDIPVLHALILEQNERDGTSYPLPQIFDDSGNRAKNIPLALVIEHGNSVEGAIIFECQGVEMMLIGCSPRVTIMAQREQRAIEYTLKSLGFNWIRCLVTKTQHVLKNLKPEMKRAGFTRSDTRFASFFKEL